MTTHEERLLEFVCNFSKFDSERGFLFSIQKFLVEQIETDPIAVFSRNADETKSDKSQWRVPWKREIDKKKADIGAYQKILERNTESDFSVVNQKLSYYVFHLGKVGSQDKYLVFSSSKTIDGSFINHLSSFLKSSFKNISVFKEANELKDLIHIDDVTGLFNQRKLHKDIDKSIKKYEKYETPFYVLFLDIDHFKRVNDGHGHLIGTKLLLEMANLLKDVLRESDLIYRYGGDEFVVIVPDVDLKIAKVIGGRILKKVKDHDFEVFSDKEIQEKFKLSVSIGVAGFPEDANTKDKILEIADKMMYQAKESGRGQVCHAGELFSE